MLLLRAVLIANALLGATHIATSQSDDVRSSAQNYNESQNYDNAKLNENNNANADGNDEAMQLSILTGSISFNIAMKNASKPAGETARLVCEITGDPKPKYIWLKDGKVVTKEDRITSHDTLWGHRLRIDNLQAKDEGWYTCVASNPFGSANTSAYLRVSPRKLADESPSTSSKQANMNQAATNAQSKLDEFNVENLAREGSCQKFSGATCAIHLKDNAVVASSKKTMLSQAWRETRLAEMFDTISQLDNITSSSTCRPELLTAALCYFAFPTCADTPTSSQPQKMISIMPLCPAECEYLTKSACRHQLESLHVHLREDFDTQLMLDCPRLLPSSNSQNVSSWYDPKACRSLGSLLPMATSPTVDEDCYSSNGVEYSGKAQTSISGQPCERWSSMAGYAHVGAHSYCRNPGSALDTPWCFVTGGKRERCQVRRCDTTPTAPLGNQADGGNRQRAAGDTDSDSLMTDSAMILVPSIAAPVLIAVILIVVFVWKRSRSPATKNGPAFTFIGQQNATVAHGSATGNTRGNNSVTSSTAHSARKAAGSKASSVVSVIPTNVPDYPISRIRFVQELGSGPFGKIYRGDLLSFADTNMIMTANPKAAAGSMPIFIKSLRPGASNKMQQDFQREIQLMSELLHPNLLNLIGVCMHDHPWCMLFEYVQFGHLHEFLILHSPTQSDNLSYSDDNTVTSLLQASRKTLTFADQVHIAKEVASGMEFLASRRFVHRDLAARNVLIGHNLSCKICDFGIAVDAYSCDYYKVQGGAVLLPVRWMAPEAVAHNRFSLETDVFSYGVLLWEIFSYGMQPYFGYSNAEVIEMVKNHQILPCPDECPVRMYALMVECWNLAPAQRPHFRDISARLRAWLAELDGLNGHDRLGLPQPIPQYYLQGPPGPLERFISIQQTSSTAAGASTSALTQEALERLNAITKAEYGGQPHFQLGNNNDADMPNAYSSPSYPRELPSQSDAVLYLQPADTGRVALMPTTQRGLTAQSAASSGALHYTRQSSAEADSMRRPTYQHAQSVTGATEHVSSSRYSRKNNAKHQQLMSAHSPHAVPPFQQQQLQPNSPPIVIEKHSSSSLINRNNLIYPQSINSEQHRKRNSSASSHRSSSQKGAEYASFAGTQTQSLLANANSMPYPSTFAASSTGGIRNPLDNHPLPSPSAVAMYIPLSHTAARSRTEPDSD